MTILVAPHLKIICMDKMATMPVLMDYPGGPSSEFFCMDMYFKCIQFHAFTPKCTIISHITWTTCSLPCRDFTAFLFPLTTTVVKGPQQEIGCLISLAESSFCYTPNKMILTKRLNWKCTIVRKAYGRMDL